MNHETHETHEKKIVWLRFVWEGEVPPEPQTWSPRAATVTERDEHEHEHEHEHENEHEHEHEHEHRFAEYEKARFCTLKIA